MYSSPGRLPHLLAPERYFDPGAADLELRSVFARAWRLVGTLDELGEPGRFLTRTLSGKPIVIRNFDGKIEALSNVCAHRHCLITSQAAGRTPTLRCQYHGWEYGADGRLARAPDAAQFAPFDDDRPALRTYPTAVCGKLVFVALDAPRQSLEDFLGPLYGECADRFGADWRPSLSRDDTTEANWKVAVENALESYHVPQVHPRSFGEDPGEARSEHRLEAGWTEFRTDLPFASRSPPARLAHAVESALLRACGTPPTQAYRHVHVFPNLLFSFTDFHSIVQAVEPQGPTRAASLVRQYSIARRSWPGWGRLAARSWSRLGAEVVGRILTEDLRLYPQVQRGLEASDQAGVLGRSEERIHAFQSWLLAREAARAKTRGSR